LNNLLDLVEKCINPTNTLFCELTDENITEMNNFFIIKEPNIISKNCWALRYHMLGTKIDINLIWSMDSELINDGGNLRIWNKYKE